MILKHNLPKKMMFSAHLNKSYTFFPCYRIFSYIVFSIILFVAGCGKTGEMESDSHVEKPAKSTVSALMASNKKNANLEKEKLSDNNQALNAGKTETKEQSDIKVTFVELGSVNCIPCKMMQPIMKEIEEEYKNQVKVVFYDVWTREGSPYAEKYKIRVIPTQVFLDKDGKEYSRHEGFFPKEELVQVLKMQGVE